MTTSMGGNDN